jgi:hypothetical protein
MNPVVKPEKLVEQVIQIQNSEGYTDQQMADKIGCSRVTYQQTRTGKIKVGNAFFTGAIRFLSSLSSGRRVSVIMRETEETRVDVELDIDGTGKYESNTGIRMFDHLLSQLAKHGKLDIKIKATGDDQHHVAEDVAICLGQAFGKALGDKRGIVRMADAAVPMDDALATVMSHSLLKPGLTCMPGLFTGIMTTTRRRRSLKPWGEPLTRPPELTSGLAGNCPAPRNSSKVKTRPASSLSAYHKPACISEW